MVGSDIVMTSKQNKTKIKENIQTLQEHHISCVEKDELMIVDEEGDARGHPQAYTLESPSIFIGDAWGHPQA